VLVFATNPLNISLRQFCKVRGCVPPTLTRISSTTYNAQHHCANARSTASNAPHHCARSVNGSLNMQKSKYYLISSELFVSIISSLPAIYCHCRSDHGRNHWGGRYFSVILHYLSFSCVVTINSHHRQTDRRHITTKAEL